MNRQHLFIICVIIRLLLVYVTLRIQPTPSFVGIVSMIVSIGFLNSYLRYKESDLGLFKGKVWWNNLRLVHSVLYFIFGLMTLYEIKYSYIILLIDILIGIIGFTNRYLI